MGIHNDEGEIMKIAAWAFLTRYAETAWMIHHPWAFLIAPAAVAVILTTAKILRNR